MINNELSSKCHVCMRKFGSSYPVCGNCHFVDMEAMTWIPDKLKEEHAANHKPIREPLTISEMEKFVKKAAGECDLKLDDLVIHDTLEGVIETKIETDDYHRIEVNFDPVLLRRHNDDGLLALCRHEMFHPLTIKGTTAFPVPVSSQEIQNHIAEIVYSYDEMINYQEYVKKFPNDEHLHKVKSPMYSNFSVMHKTIIHKINNSMLSNALEPISNALMIYQDAVYNLFEDNSKLEQWCTDNSANALKEFWSWIHEDFLHISATTTSRTEVYDLLKITSGVVLSINFSLVFTNDILTFNSDVVVAEICRKSS